MGALGAMALPPLSILVMMMNERVFSAVVAVSALLAGCASNQAVEQAGPTPDAVTANASYYKGQTVRWGGTIVRTTNRKSTTQIEVLSYPLNSNDRPLTDRPSSGRFVASAKHFLDPADYSPGRHVVVNGIVSGTQRGNVGGSSYSYAVVDAGSVSLMQPASSSQGTTSWPANVHIGIGFWKGL